MNGAFSELKKTREMFWSGAPGFEPGASCAQGRHSDQNNPLVFNATTETKQLSRDRRMWLAVPECPQMFDVCRVGTKVGTLEMVRWPRIRPRDRTTFARIL